MTKKAGAQSRVGRKRRDSALAAIGVSVSLCGVHSALAQNAADASPSSSEGLQEIVVTGIRASLRSVDAGGRAWCSETMRGWQI